MRLVTFDSGAGPLLGGLIGENVVALRPALAAAMRAAGEADTAAAAIPAEMVALIADEAAMVAAGRALAFAARAENAALRVPVASVRLLAPLKPGKILGVGRNYADHAKEAGSPKLEMPKIFLKPTSAVTGPGAAVRIPPAVKKADWEVELGVVIGRRAKDVSEGVALDHVAGYTVLDDISAREFQFDVPLAMTSFAKGMDGFCPIGPCLATADEVGEPWALDLRCWLNGEEVQHGNTRDLIFPVATLIAFLSRYMTLEPGDVIATGTPAGVGHFRNPPRYLKSGDRLRMEVERVGVLEHSIA
jgi:2-keto-4-pentenoate hydratase/2-oxohepta-3-ene-1,7-dioic acid hydratase in catechol pathway